MTDTIQWWLAMQLIALPMAPLCLAAFRRLPDRGYALSKPFALLLLGYVFWLLNSLHVLPNSPEGILTALMLLVVVSAAFAYRERDDLLAWVRHNWPYILGVEALLLLVFVLAVFLRSMVGQISGTEQPMDLMFLNAATRADHFPPEDPWLSGHSVAYYYFGYLIVAMVGQVAGVPTQVGYNIGLGMIAALTFTAAAGIVYNLVAIREAATLRPGHGPGTMAAPRERPRADERSETAPAAALPWPRAVIFGLAGAALLVVMGNLVWVLTFASAYGIGGAGFYDWVDVSGLQANELRNTWYPSEYFGFFEASRIYPLNNDDFRAITEFPMFSFLLGDLHPHVMALPFVLVVIGAALSLYRSTEPLDITFWLQRPLLLLAAAIMVGGLSFLNTWDLATMGFVVAAAAFASNLMRVRGITADLFVQVISFALPLVLLAVVLYIPFYASFSSQADGILPVVTRPGIDVAGTRPFHAFLYWGTLFAIVLPFIGARLWRLRDRITPARMAAAAAVPVTVVLLWLPVYVWARSRDAEDLRDAGSFGSQIADRGVGWITAIAFAVLLAGALLALWLELTEDDDRDERQGVIFTLLLASTALLLMLGCEFYYVGDLFNSRMNTVFKLYYQGWLLLAVAGGFSLYYLAATWRFATGGERYFRAAWAAAVAIVLAGAALYPIGGTFNRVRPYDAEGNVLNGGRSLDGLSHFPPAEREAIEWLSGQADGQDLVIAEAVWRDYTLGGRISAATGIPTVLGWGGHEDQWRGDTAPRAGRYEDIERLYTASTLAEVEPIINKYGIKFIYVGPFEVERYTTGPLSKFRTLPVAFQSGAVTIYRVSGQGDEAASAP